VKNTWDIIIIIICSPDVRPQAIADYFHRLENTLDTNSFCVILLADLNAPGFNWVHGSSLSNCHYYSKLKGDAIYTSACLLGLRQLIESADRRNLLDLVFANFPDLMPIPADSGLVKPDVYHPPLIILIHFQHLPKNPTCTMWYRNFSTGNYTLQFSHCVGLGRAI
jgi:hypothetical protein